MKTEIKGKPKTRPKSQYGGRPLD